MNRPALSHITTRVLGDAGRQGRVQGARNPDTAAVLDLVRATVPAEGVNAHHVDVFAAYLIAMNKRHKANAGIRIADVSI